MKINSVSWDQIFATEIFPNFPFKNKDWVGIAFERDRYCNTRVSEDFFQLLSEEFRRVGENTLIIKGFGEAFDRLASGCFEIPFIWSSYQNALLSATYYSVEYQMVTKAGLCACWADPELTVWGGERSSFMKVVGQLGGENAVFDHMLNDFYLDCSDSDNPELRDYLRRLVAGERRGQ